MNLFTEIIKRGEYIYAGEVTHSLHILKQNWDYYFEEEYDDGEPDLDENGFAYYAIYNSISRSRTCISEKEAIELAESTIQGEVVWFND